MAENKTKPTKVSVTSFIAALPDEIKRADAKKLAKMMQDATGEKPYMWGSAIIGFGTHHYKYDSGREGDMPIACFSPRKPATVIYSLTKAKGADALLARLGKHSVKGGCVYIKRLADIDMKVLETLIARSVAAVSAKAKAK